MRIGIIDLGTNSIRFDIREISKEGAVRQLYRDKLMVRLGQNAFAKKRLNPRAVQRTLTAFLKYRRVATKFRLAKVFAFGTAALREVTDREHFIKLIRERTGFEIRVISGVEEARLIALGITQNENVPKGRYALIDIGGGSTEISICRGRKVSHSQSFPFGVARLQEVHLKGIPPDTKKIEQLRGFIANALTRTIEDERWPRVTTVIGSSGTIRALVKLQKKFYTEEELRIQHVHDLVEMMSVLNVKQLRTFPGLDKKRADLILAGAILFEECMRSLGAERGRSTTFSLRDGIVEEEIRLLRQGKWSHVALHLNDLYLLAQSFGRELGHLKRVAELAEELFEKLKSVHRLPGDWMIYLVAASILRNIGEAVSLDRHSIHTYYLLKNADLPPMEEWEAELISLLCLHHDDDRMPKKLNAKLLRDVPRAVYDKLLGLLRLVDSFDSGKETVIRIRRVKRGKKAVTIEYAGRKLTGLEALNVEQRASSFKSVFKTKVIAERVG